MLWNHENFYYCDLELYWCFKETFMQQPDKP